MMKTMKYLSMAALLVVGAIIMSCSNNDDMPGEDQSKGQTVTVTTTISLDNGATTRALAEDGKKTFAAGDQIAVIYTNTSGNTVKATSAPIADTDISSNKKLATFTVTLENPANNGALRYIYPAAMAKASIAADAAINDANTVNYAALTSQDGTLATLASNYDLCTYDGSLTADAKLPATANLTNKLAICGFTIMTADITNTITNLTISDGTNLYVVTRKEAAGPIYVAMQPVSGKTINLYAASSSEGYIKETASSQTLEANNFYSIIVSMTPNKMESAMQATPLSLQAITEGTIKVTRPKSGMQYTKNGSAKMKVPSPSGEISVAAGDVLQFYGNGTSITAYGASSSDNSTRIHEGTADFYAYGNMMSLLDETGYNKNTTLPATYTFAYFFADYSEPQHLYSHPTKALELPATTLNEGCYYNMFYGCTHLTRAPALPAATLVNTCYKYMFQNCSSLNYVKCLTENPGNSSQSFTTYWLSGVSSSGTFVKKSSVTTWVEGASGIPSDWTINNE